MKIKHPLCCLLILLFLVHLASYKLLEKDCKQISIEVARPNMMSNSAFKIAHEYAGFSTKKDYATQNNMFGRINGEFNNTEDNESRKS